jgi:hypothetical protein
MRPMRLFRKQLQQKIQTVGMSTALDAEDEEDTSGMNNIDHTSASPYMIHTAVLPKPSLINANVNAAIDALCKIVQPEDNNLEDINHLDDDIPCNTDSNSQTCHFSVA